MIMKVRLNQVLKYDILNEEQYRTIADSLRAHWILKQDMGGEVVRELLETIDLIELT